MSDATIKTFCLAAASYGKRGTLLDHVTPVTHSVRVPESFETDDYSTLCKRVNPKSILDDEYATDIDAPPTCPTCLNRDPRFKK